MAGHMSSLAMTAYTEQTDRSRSRSSQPAKPAKLASTKVTIHSVDQDQILHASNILLSNHVQASVIQYLAQQNHECIGAFIILLQQVQIGNDAAWLNALIASLQDLDPSNATNDMGHLLTQAQRAHSVRSHQTQLSGWSSQTLAPTCVSESASCKPLMYDTTRENQEYLSFNTSQGYDELSFVESNPYCNFLDMTPTTSSSLQGYPDVSNAPTLTPDSSDPSCFTNLLTIAPSESMFSLDDHITMQDTTSRLGSSSTRNDLGDQQLFTTLSQTVEEVNLLAHNIVPQFPTLDTTKASGVLPHQARPGVGKFGKVKGLVVNDFNHYVAPRRAQQHNYRSPCPYCQSGFVSRKEFILHVQAEHERPVEYNCMHMVQTKRGSEQCRYKTCRSTLMNRHHTDDHKECTSSRDEATHSLCCRLESLKTPPKLVWGCWYCTRVSLSLEEWVEHNFEQHKGGRRREMSRTQLIKSLLFQDSLRLLWQKEIELLQASTGLLWNLQWSEDANDATCKELINELETGFCGKADLHTDSSAGQGIVKSAMDATSRTKVMLGPIVRGTMESIKRPPTSSPTGFRKPKSNRRSFGLRPQRPKPAPVLETPAKFHHKRPTTDYSQLSSQYSSSMPLRGKNVVDDGFDHSMSSSFGSTYDGDIHTLPY